MENNKTVGVKYRNEKNKIIKEYGVVIITTSGFAAYLREDSLLMKCRSDLAKFSTTYMHWCRIKMA